MWLFLSGPMGSGKSTAAREAAVSLCRPCYDLDVIIEAHTGQSIAQIFAEQGEPAFREHEAACLATLIASESPGVVALGGGALLARQSRRLCQRTGVIATLVAEPEVLAQRLEGDASRPLLQTDDIRRRLREVIEARRGVYAEAHISVDTAGRSPTQVVAALLEAYRRAPELVPLGERSYPVFIESGARERLPELLETYLGEHSRLWVTDANVAAHWWGDIERSFAGARAMVLTPGEAAKTLSAVQSIWEAALEGKLDRQSALIALGGGMVGDVAGFAASTLYRGVPFVSVPTSLLAMVDSSVGGKTGFNRPQGKNLIGSFHQPSLVVADPEFLNTLPEEELRSGLGEVVKSAWLAGEEAVAQLERDADALKVGEAGSLGRAVRMSVRLKARIVADDEREGGARGLLNLGHTLGHAFERAAGFGRIRHGEAIALGMVAAFNLAFRLGTLTQESRERGVELLRRLGLPTQLRGRFTGEAQAALAFDKKRVDGRIRFVVPGLPGQSQLRSMSAEEVWELCQ